MRRLVAASAALLAMGAGGVAIVSSASNAQPSAVATAPSPAVPQFTVGFSSTQPEPRLKALLQQHSLRPYAVFMKLDDQFGRHTAKASDAGIEVIDAARSATVTMENSYGRSLAARAKLASEGKLPEEAKGRVATADNKRRSRVQALGRGQPIIYGLWVVGDAAGADAIAKVPGVTVTPAQSVSSRVILLDPKVPAN